MSEELVKISAKRRTETGKGAARKIRHSGWIPGSLLGEVDGMVTLDPKWLSKAWKTEGKTFLLCLEGEEAKKVKIQELQLHAAKRQALHVDLIPVP